MEKKYKVGETIQAIHTPNIERPEIKQDLEGVIEKYHGKIGLGVDGNDDHIYSVQSKKTGRWYLVCQYEITGRA